MSELELDASALLDVALIPVEHLNSPTVSGPVNGRVSIGAPLVRPLTVDEAARDDLDWLDFLRSDRASRYFLVSLVCSFRPAATADVFQDGSVGIQLSSPDEPAENQPIAWSISPTRRSVLHGGVGRVKLSAKLALLAAEYERAAGPDAEQVVVTGYGERHSDPEWRFTKVDNVGLVGDERLSLVVKAGRRADVQVEVSFSATLRRKTGRFSYSADLPSAVRSLLVPAHGAGRSIRAQP